MTKPVKVEFVSRDGTVETAWCTPLGGSRYRVDNVLFLSAKPTFGDVVPNMQLAMRRKSSEPTRRHTLVAR